MADVTKPVRRGRKKAADTASDGGKEVQDQAPSTDDATDAADDATSSARDATSSGESNGGGEQTLTSELKSAIREAAIEVLKPVATQATKSAAKFAVTKGPDVVKDKVAPKIAGAGGAGALAQGVVSKGGGAASNVGQFASNVASKVSGKGEGKGKGGKKPTGYGRGRRLPVQEHIDVAVDLDTAYDQFTQFEDWPNFMHRLEKVEQRDDTTVMFHENIWGIRRSWEAEIVEQTPCERVVWRSKGPLQTVGVATFHKLSDNLTRIQINMDFQPQGLFEKTASGMRLSRRALHSDLMRFRAFVEMRDEATGDWRGSIEEGEVTESPDEQDEARSERDGDEPDASSDEDVEDEDRDEEPEASEQEEDQEEEEPEDSEEEPEDSEEEPEASEEEPEDSEEEPEASKDEDDEDDYEEDEPEASADEEEEEEEDEEPTPPRPRRRRTSSGPGSASATKARRR